MRKVFIIDNDVTGLRYTTQWEDFVPKEIASWGYETAIVNGHPNPNWRLGYINNFKAYGYLNHNISHLIHNFHVPDDSIFIFANARNPLILQLKEYSDQKGLDYKFIGYWDEGIYYTYVNFASHMYYGKYKGKYEWSLKFEKFLSSCYDYNIINNEYQMKYFKRIVGHRAKHVLLGPNPFSSLYKYIQSYPKDEKYDLIACITRPMSDHDKYLFYNMRKIYPQYDFVMCYEKNSDMTEHYRLLSKAKIVFSHAAREVNPFPIWEAVAFNCIPLIPNSNINELFFGRQYIFPRKILIPPFLNYIKARHFVHDKIQGYMENYLDYSEHLPILSDDLHNRYYNSEHLKLLLKEINEQ